MQGEIEKFFTCPYCHQSISMLLELYHGSQCYIEDCEVCCKPIQIKYETDGEDITTIEVLTT